MTWVKWLLPLLLCYTAFAQQDPGTSFLQKVRDSNGRFGYSVGTNFRRLDLTPVNGYALTEDSPSGAERTFYPRISVGFQIGSIYVYEFTPRLSFRAGTTLMFFDDEYTVAETDRPRFGPSLIEFPVYVMCEPLKNNTKIYVLLGTNFSYDIWNYQDILATDLGLNRKNTSLDVGIGFHINFLFFRLTPELRYSYGLVDLNTAMGQDTYKGIVTRNTLSFVVHSY